MIHRRFNEENYWSQAWIRHIKAYMRATPRCGIWLKSRFHLNKNSILECAGGSCRDARYLHEKGIQAQGSDFDTKTLEYLSHKFANSKFPILRQNAFSMTLDNNSFDFVFHNGFWVLFDNNTHIVKLLKEQVRVAQKYAVILVHNADNNRLVERFKSKGESDSLYNIRFFNKKELKTIVTGAGIPFKNISLEKFGGVVDKLYGFERKLSILNPILSPITQWIVPKLYRLQPWSKVERIALILEL